MAHPYSKQNLHRFLNNCTIVIICLILVALIAAAVIGINVDTVNFPASLGNTAENIGRTKKTTDPNEFAFLVVGDVKSGTATFEAMLDVMQQDKPSFAVILGDFVDHPALLSHKLFAMEMVEHAQNFPIFLVPGNHDVSEEGCFSLKDFRKIYGQEQFSFVIGKCLFVFLTNIPPYGQTGKYLEFLEQAVSNQTEKVEKTFVFMHIPPSKLNSSLMCGGLPYRENFLELVKKYHIDYVFAGHHHGYVKTEKDGTVFIVTGGGGGKLRGKHGGFHHMMRIGVNGGTITETVLASKRYLETSELIERNIVFYAWRVITLNTISIAITIVLFGVSIWLLVFSIRCRKRLKRRVQHP